MLNEELLSQANEFIDTYKRGNPYYVYVIRLRDGWWYIGLTDDLKARMIEHLTGHGAIVTYIYPPVDKDPVEAVYTTFGYKAAAELEKSVYKQYKNQYGDKVKGSFNSTLKDMDYTMTMDTGNKITIAKFVVGYVRSKFNDYAVLERSCRMYYLDQMGDKKYFLPSYVINPNSGKTHCELIIKLVTDPGSISLKDLYYYGITADNVEIWIKKRYDGMSLYDLSECLDTYKLGHVWIRYAEDVTFPKKLEGLNGHE